MFAGILILGTLDGILWIVFKGSRTETERLRDYCSSADER